MSNTIIGNVFVIDSSGVYLTGSNGVAIAGGLSGDRVNMAISNIGLYGTNTTGELALSYLSNTAAIIFHLKTQAQQGGYEDIHFAVPHKVSDRIFVNTLTAGTGYLYLA